MVERADKDNIQQEESSQVFEEGSTIGIDDDVTITASLESVVIVIEHMSSTRQAHYQTQILKSHEDVDELLRHLSQQQHTVVCTTFNTVSKHQYCL